MISRRNLLAATGTIALACLAGALPVGAVSPPAQTPLGEAGSPEIAEAKAGGRGKHRGWRRGGGKAWGRRRKFGM